MSWHPFAAALAAFTSLTSAAAQAPVSVPVPVTDVEILDLRNERHDRMTIEVMIGEEGPFDFLIDTGAQATVLSRSLADRLELFDRDSATLVGMATTQIVETTPIADFGLGSRSFHIRTAAVVDGVNIGGADGILGLDTLQDQRVLLDFGKKTIAVAEASQLGGNNGFEIVVRARNKLGQLIITNARLDGIPIQVIVDTGAQGSVGNMPLLDRLRRSKVIGGSEMTDVNGGVLAGDVRLGRQLELGRATVNNFPILFADSRPFHTLGLSNRPALILGMAELKLFRRVAIDFKSRRVLFDLPAGVALESRGDFGRFGT